MAMGNTRTAPYSYCVDAHAGLDADIVSWEMVRAMRYLQEQSGCSVQFRSVAIIAKMKAVAFR